MGGKHETNCCLVRLNGDCGVADFVSLFRSESQEFESRATAGDIPDDRQRVQRTGRQRKVDFHRFAHVQSRLDNRRHSPFTDVDAHPPRGAQSIR